MGTFIIEGGHQLKGKIQPQGAKNEALQILCAVLLTEEKITIHNIPDIVDVNKLIALLKKLGVKIEKLEKGTYTFQSDDLKLEYLESPEFKEDGKGLRGSIMIVGPLLARFGRGYIPKPGGDKIGRRRLDTHFEGFINAILLKCEKLKPASLKNLNFSTMATNSAPPILSTSW